ncbi:MAG: hypothetical protein ABEJ22_07290 [Haloferacaceae archaeon]
MKGSSPEDGRAEFGRNLRAQSEVIGVILLLGLTITGTTLIVTLGDNAFRQTRGNIEIQNAEKSMTQLDSKASLVAHGSTESQTVELATPESGSVNVDDGEGSMHIEIENTVTGNVISKTITLGTVRYEQGGTTIAYQGGGVWKQSGGGSVMVSPPEFDYEVRGAGTPTLTLPLVTIAGDAQSGQFVMTQPSPTDVWLPSSSHPNPLEEGKVTVTIESAFYEAWGRFFEERTSGKVTYDHPNQRVTIELVVPKSMQTSNAIASSAGTITVGNGGSIDSYNSDNGPYTSPGGDDAPIVVDGNFEPSNNVEIGGRVRANGDADIQNSLEFPREVIIDGSTQTKNSPIFHGRYSTGGDLTMQNTPQFEEDLIVGGDLSAGGTIQVDGDLYVGGGGPLVIPSGSSIGGDVIAVGPVTIEDGVTIGGNVHASDGPSSDGDVTFGADSYTTDVVAEGTVTVPDSATVTGTVETAGEVDLLGSGTVVGNVRADGDEDGNGVSIEMSTGSTIDGDAYGRAAVEDEDGTVTGSVQENSGPVTVTSPASPVAPLSANVKLPDSVNSEITSRGNEFASSNNNGDVAAISGSSLSGCDSTCTLPSGDYYLSDVNLGNGDTLELDTSGGSVHVYVDGPFDHGAGTIDVQGDGRAIFYLNDDYTVDGGTVVNPDDRAPQLWLLMRSDSAATFTGNSVFKGVVYGPPSASHDGVTVTINNNVDLYGGIVGKTSAASNNYNLHFDRSLEDYAAVSGSSAPQVTYLHISVTEVEIDDE